MNGGCCRAQGKGGGEGGVKKLVEAKGLLQISDPAALMEIVDTVLAANAKQLEQYRGGKTKLQGFFVGCAGPLYHLPTAPPPSPAAHVQPHHCTLSAHFPTPRYVQQCDCPKSALQRSCARGQC